jgi:HAE1 family hydrophobic/amphiphilic exporter-1
MIEQEHKLNWVARLTSFFMSNQQLSIMLFVILVLLGAISLVSLRREGFPQVPVKIAIIQTTYRGASPAEVERSVTTPIESALKGNTKIQDISSQSQDNVSFITATIDPKANLDAAIQEISSKVGTVQLPTDADKPEISQPATGSAAFTYGLSSDKLTPQQLVRQGELFAAEMAQVKGVKQVTADVEVTVTATINYDAAKLAALGVDASQLTSTLKSNNLNLPAGTITSGDTTSSVIFNGRYDALNDLQEVRLSTVDGGMVRVADVATITEGVDSGDKLSRFGFRQDGKTVGVAGLTYGLYLKDDADILDLDTAVTKAVQRLHDEGVVSGELVMTRIYDQAFSTRQQIHEIQAGAFGEHWDSLGVLGIAGFLFGGIWLLAIAMAVFVNIRAAVVAALAVPLSFLVTVISLWVGGITLNTLTLFSMILVLGLVVDPVIVVLEALQRYKDRGYRGTEAALRAVDSVGQGVLMAVLISAIVFTPFGIVSGVFGEIIRFIPLTVIPALVASFFIPVLFLTAVGARLLKSHHHEGDTQDEEASLWRASLWFQRVNRAILRRWWAQVAIIGVAFALPLIIAGFFFGTGKIQSVQFSSPSDTDAIAVTVQYPTGRSQAAVAKLANQTEAALNGQAEVLNYFYLQQSAGTFMIMATLTEPAERDATAAQILDGVRAQLPTGEGVDAVAETLGVGPPTDAYPVKLQVYDNDQDKLQRFAVDAANFLRTVDGVRRTSDGYTDGAPNQITVTPSVAAVAQTGLTPVAVGGQLSSLLSSQAVTKLQSANGEIAVESVITSGARPTTPGEIEALRISTPTGPVTLGSIASVTSAAGTGALQHFNGNRFATVRAQVEEGVDQNRQAAIQQELTQWAKDHRADYGLREDAFTSKGENDDIAKSFTELFMALGAAILLTYAVLVIFFRSFLQPLIITFAVPLSFIGVFPALYFFGGGQFGFLEILGMITLVGIVENVGIFVIDYANRRVREDMDYRDAISLATAVRFRPIFLTKVCALGSLLPLAIISPFWRGLASVIVAGILTSGITSLFTTPILYHWIHKLQHSRQWLQRRFSRGRRSGTPKAKLSL